MSKSSSDTAPEQQSEESGLQFFDSTEEMIQSINSEPQQETQQPEESDYVDPEAAPTQEEVQEEVQEEQQIIKIRKKNTPKKK